jgi:hypothetical protein
MTASRRPVLALALALAILAPVYGWPGETIRVCQPRVGCIRPTAIVTTPHHGPPAWRSRR